jgi:hypothetical protein
MTGLAALDMDSRSILAFREFHGSFFVYREARSTVAHNTPEAKISPAIR